jgi:hypothetical protein
VEVVTLSSLSEYAVRSVRSNWRFRDFDVKYEVGGHQYLMITEFTNVLLFAISLDLELFAQNTAPLIGWLPQVSRRSPAGGRQTIVGSYV